MYSLRLVVLFALASCFGFGLRDQDKHVPTADIKPRLLKAVWYLEGREGVRMVLCIGESGKVLTVRDVENWAMQASHWADLSKEDLVEVRKQISMLPKGGELPPIRDRIDVYLGKSDAPAYYPLSRLPKPIREIYRIAKAHLP